MGKQKHGIFPQALWCKCKKCAKLRTEHNKKMGVKGEDVKVKIKRVQFVCPDCGSTDVSRDAQAEWDVAEQRWVLFNTLDACYCEQCDEVKKYLAEAELSELPAPSGQDALRLRDAAPDLLEACQRIITDWEHNLSEAVQMAAAAVRKAKGGA